MPTFGLPLVCPKCPAKHYFGVLKGENHLQSVVKPGKSDICPNCKTQLVRRT
jgi:hypothetical protein